MIRYKTVLIASLSASLAGCTLSGPTEATKKAVTDEFIIPEAEPEEVPDEKFKAMLKQSKVYGWWISSSSYMIVSNGGNGTRLMTRYKKGEKEEIIGRFSVSLPLKGELTGKFLVGRYRDGGLFKLQLNKTNDELMIALPGEKSEVYKAAEITLEEYQEHGLREHPNKSYK
ncbi:hypothetical protein [Peribacillus sp. SCS-37]|uniref:hypothetical protein n=1 Tax=Paraperibacillus esterisolvens TaxID=3115296 RepID=UPI0039064CBA